MVSNLLAGKNFKTEKEKRSSEFFLPKDLHIY